jgi:ABC-type Fe3+-citrate transport system substrate-binding protein
MKKIHFFMLLTISTMVFAGCGSSSEEQEKAKQEILSTESQSVKVDSTVKEVKKTSQSLDSILNQL